VRRLLAAKVFMVFECGYALMTNWYENSREGPGGTPFKSEGPRRNRKRRRAEERKSGRMNGMMNDE